MDRSVFEVARNETPEVRTEFLRKHLFKNNGAVPTDIPTAALKAEEDSEPPREYGRRTIKGALPPAKFPPARPRSIHSAERKKNFERFILQDEPEAVTVVAPPDTPEKVFTAPPPEVPAVSVPVPVPVPSTPKESEDQMPVKKKNSHRIMTTPKPKAEKVAKPEGGMKLSAVDKALGNLQSLEVSFDELPSFNNYKKQFGNIPAHTFYGARNKFAKDEKEARKAQPNGRGKPADVFIPAPAGVNGHGRAHVEIIYSSDISPEPVVMMEIEKVVRDVLASFAQSNGIDVATADLQIKNFAPSGWEIRRIVK